MRSRSASSMLDVEYLLSQKPLSWQDRSALVKLLETESDLEETALDMELTVDTLRDRIEERISFSYFPTNMKPITHPRSSSSLGNVVADIEPSVDDRKIDPAALYNTPADDTLFLCNIKRSKSALQTTYTMWLEEICCVSGMIPSGKVNWNKPLLSAKRQHGLTTSCTISALLGPTSKKDSQPIGKLTKAGQVYSFTGNAEYSYGKIKV